jgi:hypothetical protein
VPNVGVDSVGEINRCGALGKHLHITAGGQGKDLVLIQVEFEVLKELLWILGILLKIPEIRDDWELV